MSYLQPHTDGKVICVFVPVFISVFSIVVTECLSYSIIQMQTCLEEAEKLIEIFFVPSSISYSDNSCPQCGANTTKTFLG